MPFDTGGAGQGAMSGASAGAAFGPWGALIGGVGGGLLGGFTGGRGGKEEDDYMKKVHEYMDKARGAGHEYYDPYVTKGRESEGILSDEYKKQLNPTSFIDEIMKHYGQSAGSQYKMNQLTKGIGNTAAAGGFSGTPTHQQAYAQTANDMLSQDEQEYLQNALGVYGQGIQGEQGFYNKGYDASSSLADLLGGSYASEAGLEYQGGQDKNARSDSFMDQLQKMLSQGAGAYSAYKGGGGGGSSGGSGGSGSLPMPFGGS